MQEGCWAPYYRSARERLGFLEDKVKEDMVSGRMIKLSHKDAKAKYGCRLLLGAMDVIEEESEKFRLIHDGTHHTLTNNQRRARDHIPGP